MREAIATHFNISELQILCDDLGQDFERLSWRDGSKETLALQIVAYFQRAGQIETLRHQCAKLRPDVKVDWIQIPASLSNAVEHTIESLHHLIQVSPEVHNSLTSIVAVFEHTRKHIRMMVEYKGAHDRLQHLELSYRMFYDLVFDPNSLKTSKDINWIKARTQRRAIIRDIKAVLQWSQGSMFEVEATDWLKSLNEAHLTLEDAVDHQKLGQLEEALEIVKDVIALQISSMDARLQTAAEGLALNILVNNLISVTEKIKALPNINQVQQVALKFGEFDIHLSNSQRLATQLQHLRETHSKWQKFDDALRVDQTQLEQSRDLKWFRRRWQRVRQNTQYHALWSGTLHELAADIDHALGTNAPEQGVCDLFFEFCSEARQIFTAVDAKLYRLCGELKDAGNPLDRLVSALQMRSA